MPLYELVMIAKSQARKGTMKAMANNPMDPEKKHLKELLKFCATHVLDNKGVVREFENSGTRDLPYRMKRHQEIHERGIYLTMKFDSSPRIMMTLSKALSLNESGQSSKTFQGLFRQKK
ncbi:hypothetical protein HDU91_003229 [Kappamyces sp. JEL0680]|nr:hypothetical protein HDU91_003229 [Kappamyces sp. JEL0680]